METMQATSDYMKLLRLLNAKICVNSIELCEHNLDDKQVGETLIRPTISM